ncbi:hypothetical protein VTN00DRAFT_7698 [Thermoascus crustaceus]|uniref:uncharacterized protein n=1 Tax=Thermoascus crustaceus TaxID=5088 RepID=UPI003741ED99
MPGPIVPPGQSPPFEVVDAEHHGAWVIITAAFGLSVSLVCLLIRLYVRLVLNPPFSYDDYVLLGATASAIIQSSVVFYAVSKGFGTAIDLLSEGRLHNIQQALVADHVFYLITIFLSKCCIIAVYLRLSPRKEHNNASWATLILCGVWIIPSIFIIVVDCALNEPLAIMAEQCKDLFSRWQFVTALNIMTECFIFLLAGYLLKGLHMPLRRKLAVLLAFASRLPIIAFASLRLYYLRQTIHSHDPTLIGVPMSIWTQVELNFSLIACTIFCLRPFIVAVSTNYGTAGDSTLESSARRSRKSTTSGSRSAGRSGTGGSFALRSLKRSLKKDINVLSSSSSTAVERDRGQAGCNPLKEGVELGTIPQGPTSPITTTVTAAVEAEPGTRRHGDCRSSVGSNDSTKLIIKKDVQYSVQYHHQGPDGASSSAGGRSEIDAEEDTLRIDDATTERHL